jgi:hypothetical protein
MNNQIVLTKENAPHVATVINIQSPEWGAKKFNYKAEPLLDNEFADTVGVGCNSKVLFESEYKFWMVASFKN